MFASGRCSCSQLELLHKGYKVNTTVRQCAMTRKSDISIKIPPRIERGPTDILKALSSTVNNQLFIPYKYPDDPFFYTHSNLVKRTLALAMESGRKSARYIFENHPELFKAKIADPLIEAYLHKPTFTEKSEVTEDTLISIIKKRYVKDAETVYYILESKGIEISKDTKQLLLELVCFYNGDEKPSTEELEIKWFKSRREDKTFKTWKDDGFAEKLFNNMDTNCPLAISAIIIGRLKYNQIEKGVTLFEEALRNGVKLPVEVYNEILLKANFIASGGSYDLRLYITNIFKEMNSKELKPNLYTLNAVLETVTKVPFTDKLVGFSWKVFNEITSVGIKPSLGTYLNLFRISTKKDNFKDETKEFFKKSLEDLHKQKLELRHPSDISFFPRVMSLICMKLHSPQLANLLDSLLLKDGNVKFLAWSEDESFYYKNYLLVHFKNETIENAMKLYDRLLAWRYTPELMVYESILKTISIEGALEFLPQIWKDLNDQRQTKHGLVLEPMLEMVMLCDEKKGSKALQTLCEAADTALKLLHKTNVTSLNKIRNMDSLVSNILIAYVLNEESSKALGVFKSFTEGDTMTSLSSEALKTYLNYCLSNGNHSLVLKILSYADRIKDPEAPAWATRSLPVLQNISPDELKWVSELAKKGDRAKAAQPEGQAKVNKPWIKK